MAEWNASGYQSVSSLQEAIATEQLSRLALGEHDHILDIGCGNKLVKLFSSTAR